MNREPTVTRGLIFVPLLVPLLASCGDGPADGTRFVVQVAGSETFTILLQDAEKVARADELLRDDTVTIVMGELRRGDGGVNSPHAWHLEPGTIDFPMAAIELCDGLPSHVDADLDTWLRDIERFCPWSSRIIERLE